MWRRAAWGQVISRGPLLTCNVPGGRQYGASGFAWWKPDRVWNRIGKAEERYALQRRSGVLDCLWAVAEAGRNTGGDEINSLVTRSERKWLGCGKSLQRVALSFSSGCKGKQERGWMFYASSPRPEEHHCSLVAESNSRRRRAKFPLPLVWTRKRKRNSLSSEKVSYANLA